MLKSLLHILTLAMLPIVLFAGNIDDKEGTIILEGKYQQRNIFIAQAIGAEGFGFCAYEIRVNGKIIFDEINSSAFEIDLTPYNFELGEDIIIEIKHKNGCAPKVLNPGGLKPKPTFETIDIKINDDQILEWITQNETGSLPFIVQQYKWNKWIDIGEVQGSGKKDISNYAFHVDFTSNMNKFRVIQMDPEGKIKKSTTVEIESTKPKLTYTYTKSKQEILFSNATGFEVHDKYGDLVLKGFSSSVDVSSLIKDDYWISFDSSTESFGKK
jgi:hypothetical protein